ncbi:5' exonuclease Apollo-like [Uloborus diversus]|uniref:5' exonuclease Apollo-like n=1 Tax=Uloborus diversus TaxID=327109 RepID=UPI002408FDA2|nr:5' exonuclease Apollo-like [Uloborus diversus]
MMFAQLDFSEALKYSKELKNFFLSKRDTEGLAKIKMNSNGHVLPGTPIAIDTWNVKANPQARIFFLSHFHGDHIVGLTNSWPYPIYASPVTCKFLIHKLKINPSLVKSLEIGQDHLIPLDLEGQEMVTVTLFDANHCPGSVMFLFSSYFGDILYTADFRYKPEIFDGFELPPIDVLYLDNTYCSPKCVFPSREDATEKILSQVHVCLVQSDRIFLGLDNLGKEDLLLQIAKETHSKICIKSNRKELMEIMGLSDIITEDESSTKVFVVATNQISGKNITLWNQQKKTHAILATARYCGYNFQPFAKFSEVHVVPFSNHSSYIELKKFVQLVNPVTIVPIIGKQAKGIFGTDISERADMSVFQQFLRNAILPERLIPESVKRAMNAYEMNITSSLPLKKRKIARKAARPWQRSQPVGIRYIVSEDSETDSDPDAVHILPKKVACSVPTDSDSDLYTLHIFPRNMACVPNQKIELSSENESDDSDSVWEITSVSGKGVVETFFIK